METLLDADPPMNHGSSGSVELAAALQHTRDDWLIKGEGNANIVLSYTGTHPLLVGKVLRLRKVKAKQQQQQLTSGLCPQQQQQQQKSTPRTKTGNSTPAATAAAGGGGGSSTAAAITALEADIWQPVIPEWQQLDAMQRELAFVQNVLAPAVQGSCTLAVAAAAAAPVPATLLQQFQGQGCNIQQGVNGLLLPDVTMLHSDNIPTGFKGVGPCVCFEVKPKAGFMPGAQSAVAEGSVKRKLPRFIMHQLLKHLRGKSAAMSRYNPLDLFGNGAAVAECSSSSKNVNGGTSKSRQQQQQEADTGTSLSSSSETVEAAVDSAAGTAAAAAGTAAAAAAAGFDVLLSRQQAALAALLECPYNNLKVFIDGAFVYGGKADVATTAEAAAAAAAGQSAAGDPQQQQQQQQVAALAGNSSSSSSTGVGGIQNGSKPLPSIRTVPRATLRAAAAAAAASGGGSNSSTSGSSSYCLDDVISSPTWAARRWNISSLMEQLKDFPQQQQQQPVISISCSSTEANTCANRAAQANMIGAASNSIATSTLQGEAVVNEQPIAAAAALAAAAAAGVCHKELLLCRVLSGILNQSGILPKLLSVQMRDTLDIEGIEQLYEVMLSAAQQQQEAATAAAGNQQRECQGKQQQQQQQRQQRNMSPADELPRHDQDNDLCRQRQRQQQQQHDPSSLLPTCRQQQLSLMRDYLTAATAKDCAIMITLQQVVQQQQQQQCHAGSGNSSSKSSGVYVDVPSGCAFAWQLSLVDVDLKPLAKVPQHALLDRQVVAVATEHHQLLQQHLQSRDRWLKMWQTQQQQQ